MVLVALGLTLAACTTSTSSPPTSSTSSTSLTAASTTTQASTTTTRITTTTTEANVVSTASACNASQLAVGGFRNHRCFVHRSHHHPNREHFLVAVLTHGLPSCDISR